MNRVVGGNLPSLLWKRIMRVIKEAVRNLPNPSPLQIHQCPVDTDFSGLWGFGDHITIGRAECNVRAPSLVHFPQHQLILNGHQHDAAILGGICFLEHKRITTKCTPIP